MGQCKVPWGHRRREMTRLTLELFKECHTKVGKILSYKLLIAFSGTGETGSYYMIWIMNVLRYLKKLKRTDYSKNSWLHAWLHMLAVATPAAACHIRELINSCRNLLCSSLPSSRILFVPLHPWHLSYRGIQNQVFRFAGTRLHERIISLYSLGSLPSNRDRCLWQSCFTIVK